MTDANDKAARSLYLNEMTISGTIMKVDVVAKTMSGGYHVDLTLDGNEIIEIAIQENDLKTINEKIFETAIFVVRPLDQAGRYESTCMVFGKRPEYLH